MPVLCQGTLKVEVIVKTIITIWLHEASAELPGHSHGMTKCASGCSSRLKLSTLNRWEL